MNVIRSTKLAFPFINLPLIKTIYQLGYFYFTTFSDVHIRLAGETPDHATQEVFAHKFVLSTRNESWGRNELKYLGKEFL